MYMQIETQVKNAIGSGVLKTQDVLPSVRKLAADLGINPNTVAHAYRNLERDGIITTVPGGGTYIAEGYPRLLKSERLRACIPTLSRLRLKDRS